HRSAHTLPAGIGRLLTSRQSVYSRIHYGQAPWSLCCDFPAKTGEQCPEARMRTKESENGSMLPGEAAEPLGDPLGTHRVLEPPGALPQPADKLDADVSRSFATEIVVDVETLNIDAASFRQMEEAAGGSEHGIGELILDTVRRRGKQHNP